MPNNELSQRDLLIKIGTQLDSFKEYTKDKFESLEDRMGAYSLLKTQVARMDERVKENTKFRVLIYSSLIGNVVTGIMAFVALKNQL